MGSDVLTPWPISGRADWIVTVPSTPILRNALGRKPVVGRGACHLAAGGAVRPEKIAERQAPAGEGRELEEGPPVNRHCRAGAHLEASAPWASNSAARWMPARMRVYVPQRQRFPAMASSMSWSVGRGLRASSAAAAMIWPGWQ